MTVGAEIDVHPLLKVMADLNGGITKLHSQLDANARRRAEFNKNISPFYVGLIDVTTSGTTDRPNNMGPRTGWYWDVHTLICQGLSAGTVAVYKNNAAGELWANFASSGQINWGKNQFILTAGDRLVFVGSASVPATGVLLTIAGIQIAAPYFGDYAL